MVIMVAGALTRVGPLVPVGNATPCRRVFVSVPRAAPARRGSGRAIRAELPLVLSFRLPVGIGTPSEVHFFFRILLAPVLLPSSSTVGVADGVLPIGVAGPQGVGLLLGFRPGYLPAPGNVMPCQLHTLVVIDELDAHDGELRLVVQLRVQDGGEPGSELVAKDAPQQPASTSPTAGSSISCQPT